MKSRVVIENSEAKIELFPENVFEKELIQNCSLQRNSTIIRTMAHVDQNYSQFKNHVIILEIGPTDKISSPDVVEREYKRALNLLCEMYEILKRDAAITASDPIIMELTELVNSPSLI